MKRYVTIFAISMCLVGMALGQETVQCRVKGQGSTREQAIRSALHQAVSQVCGVAVSTGVANVDLATGDLAVTRDAATGSRHVSVDAVNVQSTGTLTLTQTQGMVQTYEVVDETPGPDRYAVTLDVWVFDYRGPEPVKAIRLAVMPVDVQTTWCPFGDRNVPAARVSEQFTQALTSALSLNRYFTLLDRESTLAINRERRILEDPDVSPQEKSRLQAVLGADYLVVVTVPQAELRVKETINPAIGRPTREFDAWLQAQYRLLVGPTRQIHLADDLRIHLEDSQIKALASEWDADEIDYVELQSNFIQLGANRIAGAILDSLYPVQVAAVLDGGLVVLNQGGKRFMVGDVYEVVATGQAIVDPATGETLGAHQPLMGTVQITRVLPRMSYARVVSGTFDGAAVGAACRHLAGLEDQPKSPGGGRKSRIEKTSSDGVKLPFD